MNPSLNPSIALLPCLIGAVGCSLLAAKEPDPVNPAVETVKLVRGNYELPPVGTKFRDKQEVALKDVLFELSASDGKKKGRFEFRSKQEVEYEVTGPRHLRALVLEDSKTTIFELEGLPAREEAEVSSIKNLPLEADLFVDEKSGRALCRFHFSDKSHIPTIPERGEIESLQSPFDADQIYPSAPVTMGKAWKVDLGILSGMATPDGKAEFTLKKVEDTADGQVAELDLTGTTEAVVSLRNPTLNAVIKFTGRTSRSLAKFIDLETHLTGEVTLKGSEKDDIKMDGKGSFSSESFRSIIKAEKN